MLCAGMLLFDGTGRVRVTAAAPSVTVGSTPVTAAGLLAIDTGAPAVYAHGVGFAANGALCATELNPTAFNQGVPMINNRVAYDAAGAISTRYFGLPFTADGALAVTVE